MNWTIMRAAARSAYHAALPDETDQTLTWDRERFTATVRMVDREGLGPYLSARIDVSDGPTIEVTA